MFYCFFVGFLTIGFATVRRNNASYVQETLESIIQHTTADEKREIVVVVLVADRHQSDRASVVEAIERIFRKFLASGFLQLIIAPENLYPDFTELGRTFNDSNKRVAWRSKQCLDFAYLFSYCQNISEYYVHIEDDVISAENFPSRITSEIKNVEKKHPKWFCIEFSNLGFIGKLFHSFDLEFLSNFIFLFYNKQPVDFLLDYIRHLVTQFNRIVITPSLFHHIGSISSFKENGIRHTDSACVGRRKFNVKNPPAKIVTNIRTHKDYFPENVYMQNSTCFWGISPKVGDYYTIQFHAAQHIRRVILYTGDDSYKNDRVYFADIMYSTHSNGVNRSCAEYKPWLAIQEGNMDSQDFHVTPLTGVWCISIEFTKSQQHWVIFKEIGIF